MLTRRSLGLILYMIFGRCLFQSRAEVKYTTAEIEINLGGSLDRMFASRRRKVLLFRTLRHPSCQLPRSL